MVDPNVSDLQEPSRDSFNQTAGLRFAAASHTSTQLKDIKAWDTGMEESSDVLHMQISPSVIIDGS